jgi:hypothetical protein
MPLQAVEQVRRLSPKRCRFSENSTISRLADGACSVSFKFVSVDRLFRHDTEIRTINGRYSNYLKLLDSKLIERALKWHDRHKKFIFLRDLLDLSVALDFNFIERGRYTELGLAEFNAKRARHGPSIEMLVKACVRAISEISFYRESDVICAVPPSPEKEWDLPREIARLLSERTRKLNISALVHFCEIKRSIKVTSLAKKWDTLNAARLVVDENLNGIKVILLDDKYQSGTTAQFVASGLYEAGAREVNGLFCIKTWRDTDNQ